MSMTAFIYRLLCRPRERKSVGGFNCVEQTLMPPFPGARCGGLSRWRRRAQRGMASLDLLFSALAMLSAAGIVMTLLGMLPNVMRAQQSGVQAAALSSGLHEYVVSNFSSLAGGAANGSVGINTLISGGYLSPGFPLTDPWGGVYAPEYHVVSASEIIYGIGAVYTTVNKPNGYGLVAWSASVANGQSSNGDIAGVVNMNALLGRGTSSWDLMANSFVPAYSAGTMAMLGFVGQGSLIADYLYRSVVPGHPEAQQMAPGANIDMNGNSVNNAFDVTANDQLLSPKFTDSTNNAYYVSPSGQTVINTVTDTNQTVNNTLTVNGAISSQVYNYH